MILGQNGNKVEQKIFKQNPRVTLICSNLVDYKLRPFVLPVFYSLFQFLSTTRLPDGQASSHSTLVADLRWIVKVFSVSILFNNPPTGRAGIKSFNL